MKTKDKENNNNNKNILSITQIKIKLSDKKEILLSSEEARQVYEELGKLFKLEDQEKLESDIERLKKLFPEKEKEYIPYYPAPIVIREYIERPYWQYDKIWCGETTSNFPGPPDITNKTSFGAPETSALMINLTNNS